MPVDNYKKLRSKLTKFINAETYYNYAQMALKLKENTEAYSLKTHGVSSQEAYNIADSVFGKKVGYTDSIESFLQKIKDHPGYKMMVHPKKEVAK